MVVFRRKSVLSLLVAALCLTGTAWSASIDFDQSASATGGTIEFFAGSGTVVGTNIAFGLIKGVNTPLNSGPLNNLDCFSCFLNFTANVASVSQPNPNSTDDLEISLAAGGTLDIFGQIGPPAAFGPGFVVFNGTFASGELDLDGTIQAFEAEGTDEKVDVLSNYFFGGPVPFYLFGTNEQTITLSPLDVQFDGAGNLVYYKGEVQTADFVNFVPEPGSALLLLLGLGSLAAYRRRS